MRNFINGLLIGALLFGGYAALADEERTPQEAEEAAWSQVKRDREELRTASNDLAALLASLERRHSEDKWVVAKNRMHGRETPAWFTTHQMLIRIANEYEDRLVLARTETAAKYYLAKYERAEGAASEFIKEATQKRKEGDD